MSGPTLVTGATGFIGSHVVAQLLDRGEPVRVLVRDPAGLEQVGLAGREGLEVVTGDLLDPGTLPAAVEGARRVHHIAGVISLERGDGERMHRLNVETTQNLFAALEGSEVERIVYLASIFALAGGDGTPATEDSPWRLESLPVPYVQAKRVAELFVREQTEGGMPVVFAYPTFCYGPGDVNGSSSDLLVGFLNGEVPAYIAGGHNALDVRDAADGLIKAMDRGEPGRRYLLGGTDVTFRQLFGLLSWITDRSSPAIRLPAVVGRWTGWAAERVLSDPPLTEQMALMSARRWYYDDTRARKELGHVSRPLEETMRNAIAWYRERGVV
ncbi:MAG: NAD-dependent epimerase/dehydratase family protein [Solirubrobacterales bacterium]